MIDLPDRHLDMVLPILARIVPGVEVRAYGSRVNGRAWKYSDLDLAIVSADGQRLDHSIISNLQDAFSESDIPIKVDVLDWNAISENFRVQIEEEFEVIQST